MYENEYEYECEYECECESQLIDLFQSVASNSFEAPHACCATRKCFALATQTAPIVQVQDQAKQSTTVGNAQKAQAATALNDNNNNNSCSKNK